ncbi:hypothetical protein BX666DRAFT_226829 [Dichotomocladium elegans]|nr:hypothetical protein BX666DRAFT_226829 [Dichotomocladium elegans]
MLIVFFLTASEEQLARAYDHLYSELAPLRLANVRITRDNWQEYLGDPSYYGDFLVFFDQEIESLGLETLLERYLYSSALLGSVGSQLQPFVHLAFGLEQGLPQVVTQGLAYLACTFLDASELIENGAIHDATINSSATSTSKKEDEQILFDLIGADQRFGGKIDGGNTFHSSVKVLLQSKGDLLKTYMAEQPRCAHLKERLNELMILAAKLTTCCHYAIHDNGEQHLDWFLGGGQLLASALAFQTLIDHAPSTAIDLWPLANLQFLSTLCTYIVQGRPLHRLDTSRLHLSSWSECTATIVESSDIKAILAFQALRKAYTQHPEADVYLETANALKNFALKNGIWVKGGIGW